MSQITYNGVTLSIVKTNRFHQETIYDQSDTDMLYTRYNIAVTAIVTNASAIVPPSAANTSPVDTMVNIRHLLAVPRRSFAFSVAGETLLSSDGLDAHNGPKPRVISIDRITEATFLVSWAVEVCIDECDGYTRLYVSNRWTQSITYDQRWYSILKTNGVLQVRSDLRTNPDAFRAIVTPPINDGFQRGHARYTLSEDGLKLSYEFEDRQVYLLPPDPSLKATGKVFVATGTGQGAAQRYFQCNLRLEGSPETAKSDMVEIAITIALNLAAGAGGVASDPTTGQFTWQGGIGADLFDNAVELNLRCQLKPTTKTNALNINYQFLDNDIPGCEPPPFTGIAPLLLGERDLISLMSAAFSDSCLMSAASVSTGASPDGEGQNLQMTTASSGFTSTLTLGPVNILPDPTDYLEDDLPGVYTMYKIVSTYKTRRYTFGLSPCTSATGAKVAFIQTAAPYVTMVCAWTATKVGGPPELPPEDPTDPNVNLLDSVIEAENVNATEDGSQLEYTYSGRYEYGYAIASIVDVNSPIPPFLSSSAIPEISDEGATEIVFGDDQGGDVGVLVGP